MTTAPALDPSAARAATVRLYAASRPAVAMAGMSSAALVEFVGECQAGIRALEAAQTLAVARLAATEEVADEDGAVEEVGQGLGYRRLDAPDLVSEVLGLSAQQAGPKVDAAVVLASKLPSLVDAMGAGRIDAYRAGAIAEELREAPRAVCDEVLARIDGSLGKPVGVLRYRTRRALEVVDKKSLIAKARRARSEQGLRMVPNGDSTDTWTAVLPTEQSREAWAALEPLAKQIRAADGVTLDVARATAMTQLMLGHCTGTFHVHFAVPADQSGDFAAHFNAPNPDPTGPAANPAGSATNPAADANATVETAAPVETDAPAKTDAPADASDDDQDSDEPDGDGQDEGEWVVVTGLGTAGTTIVPGDWLADLLAGRHGHVAADVIGCDPSTGGLVTDPIPIDLPLPTRAGPKQPPGRRGPSMPQLATESYHPTNACYAFVKARDQRCRFPGCTTSTWFTDLDHTRPWPLGPTDPTNLACLCRRHHRIKQRPGWQVRLNPDASMDWTDPTGTVRTSHPVDHLGSTLPETPAPARSAAVGFGDATWDGDYWDPDAYTGGLPLWLKIQNDLARPTHQRPVPPVRARQTPLERHDDNLLLAEHDPSVQHPLRPIDGRDLRWLDQGPRRYQLDTGPEQTGPPF